MYGLYLVALSWFVLPSYGRFLALILPSDYPGFDRGLDVAAALAGVAALWWGAQGGPLVVTRAAVAHELGSPASRISVLLPRLVRQALTGAVLAAVLGALLLAINGGASTGLAAPALVSGVCAAEAAAVVFQAAVWLVVIHAHGGPRWILAALGALPPLGVMAFVFAGGSLSSARGLGLLVCVALASAAIAAVGLQWAPADRLWRRASALESLRSSMQTFDFQRALLDLRRAGDRPQPGSLRLARAWMPLAVWRQLAAMQHGVGRRGARLAVATATLAAIVFFADARHGLVVLAIAACSGFIGFEFSGALAATADQGVFLVHYRNGSGRVLRAQLATMLVLALLVGGIAVGWQWTSTPLEVLCVILLCGYGAMGAAVQARLGSPNLGAFVDVLGFSAIGPLLWARAMLGPAILFVGTVALSRQILRPSDEPGELWPIVAIATVVVATVVVTWPLEKEST